MVKLPHQNKLQDAMEQGLIKQQHRLFIGMSGLGHPCDRKLWMDFRWVHDVYCEPRIVRIFERGDLEEERVTNDLKEIDVEIWDEQLQLRDETGHIRGHIDGKALNVPGAEKTTHLLEIKTMNDKRFKDYVKNGLEKTNWGYYVQMNMYMGYLKLNRCVFVVTNKNDEQRNFQRYHFDQEAFDMGNRRAMAILTAEHIPPKLGERTWIDCKFCDHKEYCHGSDSTNRNCRTCNYVDIEMDGKWSCSLTFENLLPQKQVDGCEKYEKMGCLS